MFKRFFTRLVSLVRPTSKYAAPFWNGRFISGGSNEPDVVVPRHLPSPVFWFDTRITGTLESEPKKRVVVYMHDLGDQDTFVFIERVKLKIKTYKEGYNAFFRGSPVFIDIREFIQAVIRGQIDDLTWESSISGFPQRGYGLGSPGVVYAPYLAYSIYEECHRIREALKQGKQELATERLIAIYETAKELKHYEPLKTWVDDGEEPDFNHY